MAKWEYKIVRINTAGSNTIQVNEKTLNAVGQDGWELVAVIDFCGFYAYLKRRKD